MYLVYTPLININIYIYIYIYIYKYIYIYIYIYIYKYIANKILQIFYTKYSDIKITFDSFRQNVNTISVIR